MTRLPLRDSLMRDAEASAKAELLQKHELLAQTHKALEADLAQNRKALADAQAALGDCLADPACAEDDLARALEEAGRLRELAAPELLAEDLRQAQQALGEITGAFSSDDLLGRIFSSFCIGK